MRAFPHHGTYGSFDVLNVDLSFVGASIEVGRQVQSD